MTQQPAERQDASAAGVHFHCGHYEGDGTRCCWCEAEPTQDVPAPDPSRYELAALVVRRDAEIVALTEELRAARDSVAKARGHIGKAEWYRSRGAWANVRISLGKASEALDPKEDGQ